MQCSKDIVSSLCCHSCPTAKCGRVLTEWLKHLVRIAFLPWEVYYCGELKDNELDALKCEFFFKTWCFSLGSPRYSSETKIWCKLLFGRFREQWQGHEVMMGNAVSIRCIKLATPWVAGASSQKWCSTHLSGLSQRRGEGPQYCYSPP